MYFTVFVVVAVFRAIEMSHLTGLSHIADMHMLVGPMGLICSGRLQDTPVGRCSDSVVVTGWFSHHSSRASLSVVGWLVYCIYCYNTSAHWIHFICLRCSFVADARWGMCLPATWLGHYISVAGL